ncbi:hypothetical protein DXG01_012113, partial [Tephrocybe rancida]
IFLRNSYCVYCGPITAHTVEEVIKEETSEEEESSEEEEHEVHAVRGQTCGTRSSAAKNHPPWPAGKTITGYAFAHQDNISSLKAPNGKCYICTSPKHFARDCLHYGKWDSLREANLVTSELLDEQECASDR